MRRLVHHAAAGVGFVAVVTAAAVAGLGSPAVETTALAVPVAVSAPASTPSASPAAENDATRAAREAEETRSATRAALVAASTQAARRASALEQQSRAIAAQRSKIKAEQQAKIAAAKKREAEAKARAAKAAADAKKAAEAARKAEAAAKKAAEAMNAQGYKPGTTDPREIARQILKNKFDYGDDQYSCFNNIIIRESNWDINATNASSGAYGIPQALPGNKMASVAADWRTNPATQITWAIGYMDDRYGSPCSAWSFKRANGWY